jgi:hypothetical protein
MRADLVAIYQIFELIIQYKEIIYRILTSQREVG